MHNNQPDGYLALPTSGNGSPVLVLHAWWGLNDTQRSFCNRLAEAGFAAFAPDLYHGKTADTIAGAEQLSGALDGNQADKDIDDAIRFLRQVSGQPSNGLAVAGFSLGAFYALDLAERKPEQVSAVVIFYGTRPGDYSRSQAAFQGHFAEQDDFEPLTEVDALEQSLRAAGREVEFFRYPGTGHWFFEPDRTDAYNSDAAGLAWERTVSFLQRVSA